MSLFALALLAQAAVAPPPPPPAPPPPRPPKITPIPSPDRPLGPDVGVGTDEVGEEIVIIARKLRLVHVHLLRTSSSGAANCTVLKTSGDSEVDQLTCEAAKACAVKHPDRKTPADVMIQCTKDEQARRVEELAEKRIEEEMAK
jgi:hypothetical protein